MICLACGGENPCASERCQRCAAELTAVPPYLNSNHVCQLQLALAAYDEGHLAREELLTRYANFAELVMSLDSKWKLSEGPTLSERLAEPLRARYAGGMGELDQARLALLQAMELLDGWAEHGPDGVLAQVDELLTDFFRYTCAGCAWLLHELELEDLRAVKLGTLHDYVAE